jgi:hypothetical protein
MPARRRLLAIGKWTGLALCVALAWMWLASGWCSVWWMLARGQGTMERHLLLQHGLIQLTSGGPRAGPPETGPLGRVRWGGNDGPHWRMWFWSADRPSRTYLRVNIPLWAPFLLATTPTAFLWRLSRPLRLGHCSCGYNLAGLDDGVCPECGRERMEGSS